MITEDYVSYEVAKLLQEKGFDEDTERVYERNIMVSRYEDYPMPTHQMAMKWLRKNDIIISISPTMNVLNAHNGYLVSIYRIVSGKLKYEQEFGLDTYEDAVEAALKYCLTELI